ncbi:hypothetical protein SEA_CHERRYBLOSSOM_68 [Streptomyces phage CherryBlossom]|nr:hypothetical protein SEA_CHERRYBLOSSOM_68 [Streptomyces phage CherryBlossom]
MARFRRMLYRRGFRPKPGSIFHSPSQALIYSYLDEVSPGAVVKYRRSR